MLCATLLSGPAIADQWLCMPSTTAVGFDYERQTNSWKSAKWATANNKYILRKRKDDDFCLDSYSQNPDHEWWALFRFGGGCMMSCTDGGGFETFGLLQCYSGEDMFLFNKDTLRYSFNISSSYYRGGPRGDISDNDAGSAVFEIGLCSKF